MGEQERSADWEHVRSLFGRALDQPPEAREAWLADAAGDDPALLAEVRSLLSYEVSRLDRSEASSGPDGAGAARESDGTAAREVRAGRDSGRGVGAGHPAEVGPYRILSLLGEGGMGAVYEAEQSNPHRRVALKVIRVALATEEMRRRFQLEGEVLGRLRHAAIAQVYETGTASLAEGVDVPYLAMEHVVGATPLTDHVRAHVPALDDRLQLFAQIVDGIEHAHQNGIVHRDLKPANVLVDEDGNPKIIDFGLARAVDEDSDLMSMHTRTGQLMGTPLYMSPEQFSGSTHSVGVTSDVYSLGVILFELVTGELPHELRGLDVIEMARVVRDQPPKTLSQSGTRVRDDLDTIVAKALEKQAERRYENAAAFAADVRRYLRHEPVHARKASAIYQARLFARRHRALVVSVGLVLAVAIAAAVVSFGFAVEARREAAEADRLAYRAAILSASEAVDAERTAAARELLASTPEERRGWEYRHLMARLETWLPAPFPEGAHVIRGEFSLDRSAFVADEREGDARRWRVWDAATWRPGLALPVAISPAGLAFPRVALSPDGTRLLAVGAGARHVDLHDVATGARLRRFDVGRESEASAKLRPEVARVGWFHDGARFWVTHPSTELSVWDVASGEQRALFADVGRAQLSADGNWMLAVGSGDYSLIDARSLERSASSVSVRSATNGVVLIVPSTRGARFAAAMHDGSVDLLQVVDGRLELRSKLPETVGLVLAMDHSPDDTRLVMTGAAQRLVSWDLARGEPALDVQLESAAHAAVHLPGSGDLLLLGSELSPRVLPLATGDPSRLTGHASYVYPARFTPDGGTLVSGGWDGTFGEPGGLRLWDARSGRPVAVTGDRGTAYVDAAVLPGDRWLVTAELRDKGAFNGVLDLLTGATSSMEFPSESNLAERVVPLPDGRRVLSSFRYGHTYLWDLPRREILARTDQRTPRTDFGAGHGPLALSPDARFVALGDRLTGIRVLRTDDLAPLREWPAHEAPIWSLAYSLDGRWILSTSEDETAAVWDAASGALVARLRGHGADVLTATMSPDGSRIATAGRDRTVLLWDTEHFENVGELRAHEKYVYSLTWSADGETLVSASGDGTLRTWRSSTLEQQVGERAARDAALPALERRFAELAARHTDPEAVHAALLDDPALTPRDRELLRQVHWAHALRRRPGVAQVDGQRNAPAPAWYRAPRTSAPPRLDGALDDPAWERAPWTALAVDIEGAAKPAPRHATRVRMLWDDEFLYVAAQLDEPHVWATLTAHDSIIYRDNDFEIFLDPEGDGRWYGEVEINAHGTVFDLALDKPYNRGGRAHIDWTPPALRGAARVQGTLNDPRDVDTGWTLELAIPHAAFAEHAAAPLPPRAGDAWRVNFSRVQWTHDVVDGAYVKRKGVREDNWVWSPQFTINMHVPERWGWLEFVDESR